MEKQRTISLLLSRFTAQIAILLAVLAYPMLSVAQSNPLSDGTLRLPRTFKDETIAEPPKAWKPSQYQMPAIEGGTGTLSLVLPLCEGGTGDIPLPVSLSYSGSGIKAEDTNCMVGLGWTLQAWGYIKRSINGLPDEKGGLPPRDDSHVTDLNDGITYLRDILHRETDANYDRYYYSFGKYSGSFVVSAGKVIQLPETDLSIRTCGKVKDKVPDFVITTSNGTSYYFEARETSQVTIQSNVIETRPNYKQPDYTAVTGWYLTRIVSSSRSDTVRICYRHVTQSDTEFSEGILAESCNTVKGITTPSNNAKAREVYTRTTVTMPDMCIPEVIRSRAGVVQFTSEKCGTTKYWVITHIIQVNNQGERVKDTKLSYQATADERTLLTGTETTSDGELIDSKHFEYYTDAATSCTHSDLFGYKNKAVSSSQEKSVLKRNGKYSDARMPVFNYAVGLSLRSVTDANGATTTIDYEPADAGETTAFDDYEPASTAKGSNGKSKNIDDGDPFNGYGSNGTITDSIIGPGIHPFHPIDPDTIGQGKNTPHIFIGLRVKKIALTDKAGTVSLEKLFSYSDPITTIDLDILSKSAFIEPGGNITEGQNASGNYSSGATLSASCRIPGVPLADAKVYYGKIVEKATGTDIPDTLLTIMEYKTDGIRHPYVSASHWIAPNPAGTNRYLGTLVSAPNLSQSALYGLLYGNHCIRGYFQENVHERGLLSHLTVMRWDGSRYRKHEELFNTYSEEQRDPFVTGFYVTLMTRTYYNRTTGATVDKDDRIKDFNFFSIKTRTARVFKDSTLYIRYYYTPDSIASSTTVAYTYYNHNAPVVAVRDQGGNDKGLIDMRLHFEGFDEDSLRAQALHLPHSVKIRHGQSSFSRYYCYSSNLTSSYYQAINDLGMRDLPVMEKVVVDGADTLTYHNVYSHFGTDSNVRLALRRIIHGTAEVASQRFGAYDAYGNPLSTTLNHGPSANYRWDYHATLPVIKSIGAERQASVSAGQLTADMTLLTTRYTHKPLVGCTAVTNPDGRTTSYGYEGTRLSTITNNGGLLLTSYAYRLDAESPGRGTLVSETMYTGDDASPSVTRQSIYNALGLEVFSVQKGAAPNGSDIVTMAEYDGLGKPRYTWLPVAMDCDADLTADAVRSAAQNFYADSRPFAEQDYLAIAEKKVSSERLPGQSLASHPVTYDYLCSTRKEGLLHCRRFRLCDEGAFCSDGSWGDGDLDVTLSTDGDGRKVWTFTDYRGQKVLERRLLSGQGAAAETADTYYLYDALGNLRFVLPPALKGMDGRGSGPWTIATDEDLKRYAYYYRYDSRLDLVEKKLPGAETIRYVHDLSHQVVLTQDGNQRADGEWRLTLADGYGRTVLEALVAGVDTTGVAGRWVHATGTDFHNPAATLAGSGYKADISASRTRLLLATYYDNYNVLSMKPLSDMRLTAPAGNARGLKTATLSATSNGTLLGTITGYDDEGRPSIVTSSNILGGTDRSKTTYTRDGRTKTIEKTHTGKGGNGPFSEYITFTYDAAARLARETHRLGSTSSDIILVNNTYDGAGRLVGTGHASSSALSESFTYNLPGWLTSKASTLFKEQLGYNHSVLGAQPQYGGNISSMRWTVKGDRQRGYAFSYDNLSRLTSSAYMENGARSTHYDTQYSYDLMGNLLSLKRNGLQDDGAFGPIDDLTYSYDGNQLRKVDDTVVGPFYKDAMHFVDGADEETEYTFDANGNMTQDLNKGITQISYNTLNLPKSIIFGDGQNSIAYAYSADGTKLRTRYTTGTRQDSIDYCGNIIYRNGRLDKILVDGGYISFANSDINLPKYHFYLTDHLGNIRVVADAAGNIEETNHYYPYGALMGESYNTTSQPYKYNGKELDRMHGLDLYDYGARMYNPTLGMWMSTDIMQERKPEYNSYCYVFNNPQNVIDPDGNIEWPLKGFTAVNKKYYKNGAYGLKNTIVRTSLFMENRKVGTSPHVGIDYRASIGTPVYSLGDGKVVAMGTFKSGIKYITIEYGNGDKVRFLHLSQFNPDLKVNSIVYEGQQIGLSGNSGRYKDKNGKYHNYPAHLHVDAVDKSGEKISPELNNYGTVTNKTFFGEYKGDYNLLRKGKSGTSLEGEEILKYPTIDKVKNE